MGENKLLNEFEELIKDVSQEIIDNTVMDDLKALRQELTSEMTNFSEQAAKINSITEDIDRLLSQTTLNLTSIVETTTRDLDGFLKETNEVLHDKLSAIIQDLDKVLEGSSELIKSRFADATSEIREMLSETTSSIESAIITSKRDVKEILNESNERFDGTVNQLEERFSNIQGEFEEHITKGVTKIDSTLGDIESRISGVMREVDTVMASNSNNMITAINDAISKIDATASKTEDHFTEEIKLLKSFLINADKLIKNNQYALRDTQISIEEKLTDTVTTIKEDVNRNKLNFNQSIGILEEISKDFDKQMDLMSAKNESVLSKQESMLEILHDLSSTTKRNNTFSLALNILTILLIIAFGIYQMIGG